MVDAARSEGAEPNPGGWFDEARFGMFIHVSHANGQGWELSWPLVGGVGSLPSAGRVPAEHWYDHIDEFRPAPDCAQRWCRAAADAGMGYAVLVTKHHDGVCNFPSASPSLQLADGRDLVGEFVTAARAHGLRVGLYFSLSDWAHPDYPAWQPSMAPYSFFAYPRPPADAWERFGHHLRAQLTQLLTDYGRIDELWFDGGWERMPDEWGSAELETLIRTLQPDILINDRLPGLAADFATPEQLIPAEPAPGRTETCMTLNRSWGWVPTDTDYKSGRDVVQLLAGVAGLGGNLLLNVSPMPDGSLPQPQVDALADVGAWMERNRDAVVGTVPGLEPWQWYGPSTRRGGTVHLICVMAPYERVTLRGVQVHRVRSVVALASGRELEWSTRVSALDEILGGDCLGEVVIEVPADVVDPLATVLSVDFADSPLDRR